MQYVSATHFSIRTKIFLIMLIPSLLLIAVILIDYGNLTLLGRSAELILSKNGSGILYVIVSLRGFAKPSRRDGVVADSSP